MSLTINLSDDSAEALRAKAHARGLSVEEYARELVEQDLAPKWLRKSWESAKRSGLDHLSAEEIDAEIAAARKARRESRPRPGS